MTSKLIVAIRYYIVFTSNHIFYFSGTFRHLYDLHITFPAPSRNVQFCVSLLTRGRVGALRESLEKCRTFPTYTGRCAMDVQMNGIE